jgi:hypothetical protein
MPDSGRPAHISVYKDRQLGNWSAVASYRDQIDPCRPTMVPQWVRASWPRRAAPLGLDLDQCAVRVVRPAAQMNDGKLIDQEPKSRGNAMATATGASLRELMERWASQALAPR